MFSLNQLLVIIMVLGDYLPLAFFVFTAKIRVVQVLSENITPV